MWTVDLDLNNMKLFYSKFYWVWNVPGIYLNNLNNHEVFASANAQIEIIKKMVF